MLPRCRRASGKCDRKGEVCHPVRAVLFNVCKHSLAVGHLTQHADGMFPQHSHAALEGDSNRTLLPGHCQLREWFCSCGDNPSGDAWLPLCSKGAPTNVQRGVVGKSTSMLAGKHVCRVSYCDKLQWYTGDHGQYTTKSNCIPVQGLRQNTLSRGRAHTWRLPRSSRQELPSHAMSRCAEGKYCITQY